MLSCELPEFRGHNTYFGRRNLCVSNARGEDRFKDTDLASFLRSTVKWGQINYKVVR